MAVFRAIHVGLHEPWMDPIFTAITYTGLGAGAVSVSLLLLLSKSTRRFLLPVWLSMFLSGIALADGIKALVARDRPSNLAISHPQEHIFYSSFPSGHTSCAAGAGFVILFMTWGTPNVRWGWFAVFWSVLVGISRIYRGVHWPSDALAGMFDGMLAAALTVLIFRAIERRPNRGEKPQASIL